jgi:hypothetical protein
MTYSEPTPEQETAGQDEPEQETAGQDEPEQDAAGHSEEPGKPHGDPLFAEIQEEHPDAGAGTATSAAAG